MNLGRFFCIQASQMRLLSLTIIALLAALSLCLAEESKTEAKEEEKYRGRLITLRDFGSHDLGFLSLPDAPPKYGVLLLPDSRGMSDEFKKRCDWVAEQGAIALGLDFFNGHTAETDEDAALLQKDLRKETVVKTIQAALSLLSESPRLRAEHIVVLSFGPQWLYTLPSVREFDEKKVCGLTWVEPRGAFDEEMLEFFRESKLPIQIIDPWGKRFLQQVRENLDEGRRKRLTFFLPPLDVAAGASTEPIDTWKEILDFWHQCAVGSLARKAGFFERIFD